MRMNDNKSWSVSERIILILVISLYSSFVIFSENTFGMFVIVAIVCCVFIIDAFQGTGIIHLKIESYHIWMAAFSVYCAVSSLWAIRSEAAIQKGITIFEILICMSFIYNHYLRMKTIQPLLDAMRWGGYAIAIYTILYYGVDVIKSILVTGVRLDSLSVDSVFANANNIGLAVAYSVILAFYNIFFVDKKAVISDLLLIPCMLVIAATGSRKAIILVVIGVFLLVLKRFSTKNVIRNVVRIIAIIFISLILLYFLSKISIFSGINERLRGLLGLVTDKGVADSSAILRQRYINIGLEQFLKQPVLGIGIGSSGAVLSQFFGRDTYFHNNFVEMLACGGIVGFIIYYSFYWHLWIRLFKCKKKWPSVGLCLILIGLLLFADFGSVSYYSKDRYFILLVIALECHYIKQDLITEEVMK